MEAPGIDSRDLEILQALEEDARIAWRQLAKKLGVSEATIYLRVKKLHNLGIIRRYTIKVDLDRLGVKAKAFVRIKSKPGMSGDVAESLARNPNVVEAYETTGHFNFIAFIVAPSLEEVSSVINSIASSPGVEDIETIFVMRVVKEEEDIVRLLAGRSGESPRP